MHPHNTLFRRSYGKESSKAYPHLVFCSVKQIKKPLTFAFYRLVGGTVVHLSTIEPRGVGFASSYPTQSEFLNAQC